MVREERSGRMIRELDRMSVPVENMWVGETMVVLVPGDFKHDTSVCCIMMIK